MADVEKVSSTASPAATTAADIPSPVSSVDAGGNSMGEYGTSPTQERSSNSHAHDSEYDTASDLEGVEEYDDDDDEEEDEEDLEDESLTDGESMTDDEVVAGQEKAEIEAQKKVDEDRSNPQYIPKRGTFYEHDDRTVECDVDSVGILGESGEILEGIGTKPPQSPTISQASKTMKKWQPASAVERWSHDRFDATEQAPKSRAELVSAYGYDIRTEDAPPRARRRRRYGRGPSKYSRNWEDESAYLKASNKDRKPPRPSDFPALNERNVKTRKMRVTREEKENRMEKRAIDEKIDVSRSGFQEERREGKGNNKSQKFGRQSTQTAHQVPMEFKQKQRNMLSHQPGTSSNTMGCRSDGPQNEKQGPRAQNSHPMTTSNEANQKCDGKIQTISKYTAREPCSQIEGSYAKGASSSNHSSYSHIQPQQAQHQQQGVSTRHQLPSKTPHSSNLSQRLQQVQNRNDPSHVGSVQMHALATQNQIVNQHQQLNTNMGANAQQPTQQQSGQQMPQEQRGPPKRYSSLRRSQHEAQHIAEQLQHMHLQQQQSPIILPDQHMLQSNLMQLYHQENLQAQMQVLQAGQTPGQAKQQAYSTVTPGSQSQPYAAPTNATGTQATYYVAPPDAFNATSASSAQVQSNAQYAQQPPNYLPPSPASTTTALAYPTGPPSSQSVVPGSVPNTYGTAAAVQPATAAPATGSAAQSGNSNYSNYQNYNTVGGTTYFVPPAQASTRPVVLPQRRPTNAIPILPPSEKNKLRSSEAKEEVKSGKSNIASQPISQALAPIGSAENIDHIIDNMFVQRPAFQPPQATVSQTHRSSSPIANTENNLGEIGNGSVVVPPDDTVAKSTATGEKANTNFGEEDPVENSNNSIVAKE